MGLTAFMLERRTVAYFLVFLIVVGGVAAFLNLGRLEDPDFSVKKAVVITPYPGASPEQVELEVTDRIEKAIQELPQLDTVFSFSRAGVSIIKVEIKQEYWADRLPQIWDELRKKIRDVTLELPPGVGKPDVSDDFSFVYGFVLAITGDGFTYAELEDYADLIKKELSVVSGVSRVELWGVQDKVVYLDVSEAQVAEIGISNENFLQALQIQNKVVEAGSLDIDDRRLRIAPSGEFASPEEIGELALNPNLAELMLSSGSPGDAATEATQILRIQDVATVRSGYRDPPFELMRYDGQPGLAIYAANVAGGNVVRTGAALDKRIGELMAQLPVGIELHKVAWQSDLVTESIDNFMISLAQAVAIVLVVLMLPSGLRMGMIIGSMLLFIILGSFVFMGMFKIDLHRMSLGALIIALGMMVDNSTFVADKMSVLMQKGMDRTKAAIAAAGQQAMPLLGATVIAIMAFYPIYASPADAGEYCASLFTVVAIALSLSWFISMTLTPVMCVDLLPQPKAGAEASDPYASGFFRALRSLVALAIRFRWVTILLCSALLAGALLQYGNVRQMFFPDATRNQLMLDYWAPEGTRIQDVSESLRRIEDWLKRQEEVAAVVSFVGNGPPRFYLPVDPELPNPAYAQIIVNTPSFEEIQPLADKLEPWLKTEIPVLTRVRKYGVGPSDTWKVEARISGPAEADLGVLREIGEKAKAILRASPLAREVRTEMREPVLKLVPQYNQERARWATVSREDLGQTTLRAYDGLQVGLYREGDDLYPILLRNLPAERSRTAGTLDSLQVRPQMQTSPVPLGQIVDGFDLVWEDPIIHRYQRRRAVTVQASPLDGETFPSLYADVAGEFAKLESELPIGYEIFWDGEMDSTNDAQLSLIPGLLPTAVLIAFIVILLYNSLRVLLCILLVVPFAAIGIVGALIALDSPMGFVAILGVLSLTGMMIKNMIVMTNAINEGVEEGLAPFDACVEAAVTQARPIALAAGTTVLGVVPILPDVFWNAMAASIMGGLAVGSILTIVLFPTFYATLHGIRPEPAPVPAEQPTPA